MSGSPLLTIDEHRAVELLGELWNLSCRIVGNGPSRQADMSEIAQHIHVMQQSILSQAAARAYPELYRLLGDERR